MRGDRIRQALFDSPWLCEEKHLQMLIEVVEQWASSDTLQARLFADEDEDRGSRNVRVEGDTAFIQMRGTFFPRSNLVSALSGGVDSTTLASQIDDLSRRGDLRRLVLDVDSGGGSPQGLSELGEAIYDARNRVDVVGVANYNAASAAYWALSQAGTVLASPSSNVGSIGVVMGHVSRQENLERQGVKATILRVPGPMKAALTNVEDMSEEVRTEVLKDMNKLYDGFVTAVARGRGTSEENVRSNFGAGRMFPAAEAVERGMADEVRSLSQLPPLRTQIGGRMATPTLEVPATAAAPALAAAPAPVETPDSKALREELAQTRKELKDSRRRNAIVDMRRELADTVSLGVNVEEVVSAMVEVQATVSEKTYTTIRQAFVAAGRQASKFDVSTETGDPEAGLKPGSAYDEFEAKAKALVSKGEAGGGAKTLISARVMVQKQHPELAKRLRKEMRNGV